jgi:hypothetical protein
MPMLDPFRHDDWEIVRVLWGLVHLVTVCQAVSGCRELELDFRNLELDNSGWDKWAHARVRTTRPRGVLMELYSTIRSTRSKAFRTDRTRSIG